MNVSSSISCFPSFFRAKVLLLSWLHGFLYNRMHFLASCADKFVNLVKFMQPDWSRGRHHMPRKQWDTQNGCPTTFMAQDFNEREKMDMYLGQASIWRFSFTHSHNLTGTFIFSFTPFFSGLPSLPRRKLHCPESQAERVKVVTLIGSSLLQIR